ncbi:MAG: hypothetical protein HXS52_06070 [Theionarchaea archaeon]|nr:hypothetical protein [Theionarchaea archaeon]MBU7037477.1 hypothetical protein [Theionarchaea archaeon]
MFNPFARINRFSIRDHTYIQLIIELTSEHTGIQLTRLPRNHESYALNRLTVTKTQASNKGHVGDCA